MEQTRPKHPFIYLLEPLAIRWGLSIGVELILIAILGMEKAGNYLMEATALISIVTIIVFWRPYQKERKSDKEKHRNGNLLVGKNILAIVVCGFCICISVNGLIIQSGISQYSEAYQATSQSIYGTTVFLQLIGAAFLAPVAEEFVYRGMLYRRMRVMLPVWMSVLGSAMIFGISHGNMVQFIFALFTGAVMAYLYEVYHTLKATILFHITLNLTSLICTWLNVFSFLFENIYLWTCVTLGTLVVGIAMIRYVVKLNSQNNHK